MCATILHFTSPGMKFMTLYLAAGSKSESAHKLNWPNYSMPAPAKKSWHPLHLITCIDP